MILDSFDTKIDKLSNFNDLIEKVMKVSWWIMKVMSSIAILLAKINIKFNCHMIWLKCNESVS